MFQLKDDLLLFMTADEIRKTVKNLAKQINSDYANQDLVIISPMKGSMHLTADLVRELHMPCRVEFVLLQTVRNRIEGMEGNTVGSRGGRLPAGSIKIVKDINMNLSQQHILIVEEIVDNGRTLSFLRDRLMSTDPASIKILTLLDKPSRRELPIRPDYVGRTIDDRFVVGYGMDSEEMGRNYPDIYFLKN